MIVSHEYGFLSPNVRSVLIDNLFQKRTPVCFIQEGNKLNVKEIETLCIECGDNLPLIVDKVLYPLAWAVCESFDEIVFDFFDFTGHIDMYKRFLKLYSLGDDVDYLVSGLLSLSFFERTLVDLFCANSNNTKPPPLFRDMLEHPIMVQCLGKGKCQLLRAFSHPNGMNLRNCLWHGFIYKLPRPLLALIFGIIQVTSQNVGTFVRKESMIVKFQNNGFGSFDFSFWIENFEKRYERASLIPKEYLKLVNAAMLRAIEGYDLEAISLLCISLEMGLRTKYCEVNNLPHLSLTADNSTLYCTMETFIEESNNLFPEFLGINTIYAIQDVFFFQGGPRIRDSGVEDFQWFFSFYFKIIDGNLKDYESKFHPKSLAIRAMQKAMESLSLFSKKTKSKEFKGKECYQDEDLEEVFRCRVQEIEFESVQLCLNDFLYFRSKNETLMLVKKLTQVFKDLSDSFELFEFELRGDVKKDSKILDGMMMYKRISSKIIGYGWEILLKMEQFDCEEWIIQKPEKLDKFLVSLQSFVANSKKAIVSNSIPTIVERFEKISASFEQIKLGF